MPQLWAIARWLSPSALSRSTSRILRMDNLPLGTTAPFREDHVAQNPFGHPAPPPHSPPPETRPKVDGFPRNPWTISIGIDGRFRSESVDDLRRNRWTVSVGLLGSGRRTEDGERNSVNLQSVWSRGERSENLRSQLLLGLKCPSQSPFFSSAS